MNLSILFSILGASLLLAGCAAPERTLAEDLPSTTWTLTSLGGAPVEAPRPPTLEFGADGRVSGFAGVNRYSTSATIGPGADLAFSPAAATKMAGPPELMSLEDRFLEALGATRAAAIDRDTLTLFDSDDASLARFSR